MLSGAAAYAQEIPCDYADVLKTLDRKGDYKAQVLKVNIPRNDVKVSIDGIATRDTPLQLRRRLQRA